jgi:hypothetical protein
MYVKNRAPKAGVLATGLHGRINWHYYPAADVRGFMVERDERGILTLRASIANADTYKLTKTPLTFIVTLQRGSWHWPIEEVIAYDGDAFTARLGAPMAKGN